MTVYQKNLKQKVQAYLERLIAYVDSLKETTHTSLDQVLKAQLALVRSTNDPAVLLRASAAETLDRYLKRVEALEQDSVFDGDEDHTQEALEKASDSPMPEPTSTHSFAFWAAGLAAGFWMFFNTSAFWASSILATAEVSCWLTVWVWSALVSAHAATGNMTIRSMTKSRNFDFAGMFLGNGICNVTDYRFRVKVRP